MYLLSSPGEHRIRSRLVLACTVVDLTFSPEPFFVRLYQLLYCVPRSSRTKRPSSIAIDDDCHRITAVGRFFVHFVWSEQKKTIAPSRSPILILKKIFQLLACVMLQVFFLFFVRAGKVRSGKGGN